MVNMYDLPALAKFVNTYVPINFDLLYRVGQALRQEVDKAVLDLSGRIEKWSEFQSPSEVDTKHYYDLTLGKMAPTVQELASNPDMLKTVEGRSKLLSLINGVDYRTLSNLKQGKENFLARLLMNQKLALEDKFNPTWHDVDFRNYDTIQSGIFSDIAPLAYKSEVDLVKPYVDNLKASWIKNQGGFEYSGVTADRTDRAVIENLSSIYNTPEYAKHLQVLQNQGLTPEQAKSKLDQTLIIAGREFETETRERDPWFIESMRLQARAAENVKETGSLLNLTTIVQRDAAKNFLTNFSGLSGNRVKELMSGARPTMEEQQVLSSNLNPKVIQDNLRKEFGIVSKNKRSVNAGANYVLDKLSSQLSPEATDIYSKIGAGEKIGSNTYKANDSSNFMLADNLAYGLMGTTRAATVNPRGLANVPAKDRAVLAKSIIVRNKFEDLWSKGKFTDFIVKGENKQVTDGNNSYLLKYAYIPTEQFADFTDEERALVGGQLVKLGSDYFTKGKRYDAEGNLLATTESTKQSAKYYVKVKVTNQIPVEGESSTAADNVYSKKTMGLGANPQYGQVAKSQEERMN